MNALERLDSAISQYWGKLDTSVHRHLPDAAARLEIQRQLRIFSKTDRALEDLLGARERLLEGSGIKASELHGPAVLKALGLTAKERRAVFLFYALGTTRRRSIVEIANELKMSERQLSTYIQAIRRKVPEIEYPFFAA